MYRDFEIVRACFLVIVSMILSSLYYTELTTDIARIEIIDVNGFFKISDDILTYQTANAIKNSTSQDVRDRTNQTKLLADIFATRIDKITDSFETSSKHSAVRNISYANLVGTEFMGIPESSDIEKRNVAKVLLQKDPILGGVYFTLPNGNVYLGEPYSAQAQLPKLNFADRDWYKGVSKINDTYISSVFISASTHAPATAIALPVYENNSKIKLLGYWVGIINIKPLWEKIKDDNLPVEQELIVIDHEGTEMFNSGKYNYTEIQSIPSLQENGNTTISNADRAKVRSPEGDVVAISYPIHICSHVWTVTTIY
jgi:Cache domain